MSPLLESSWCAGVVNHGAYDDLDRCLESIRQQTHLPARVFVYDTGVDPKRLSASESAAAGVDFEMGPNIGYAGGANRVVEVLCEDDAPRFILVLNPDVMLDANFAESLIGSVGDEPRAAIATGKLLRPGREILDSAGIIFPAHRRPRDRGSESVDRGQFDRAEWVDAASGAAMLLRVSVLPELMVEGELFDESFFAYHEDTDLCWRARRFGYQIRYEPKATAVHVRGWRKDQRGAISTSVRRHSFKNHYLQWIKNESFFDGLVRLPWFISWEVMRLGFAILRDRSMLRAYSEVWPALPQAFRRRRIIAARAAGLAGKV